MVRVRVRVRVIVKVGVGLWVRVNHLAVRLSSFAKVRLGSRALRFERTGRVKGLGWGLDARMGYGLGFTFIRLGDLISSVFLNGQIFKNLRF